MNCFIVIHLFRSVPKVGAVPPSGFICSKDHSMTVEFYAILPFDVWKWDQNSQILMRFGCPEFGDWEHDNGPGEIDRCCLLTHLMTLTVQS